ncbi:hypothetical protein D3C72_2375570 [compost metagenome]
MTSASRVVVSCCSASCASRQIPVDISIMLVVTSGTIEPGTCAFLSRASISGA